MPLNLMTGTGAYGGTVAAMPGGRTQAGQGPYGEVPTVPSLGATQQQAIQSNVSQLDQIKNIMEQINQQSAQSAQYPMLLNLPGYTAAMGAAMGNVQDYLGGRVPADVQNLLSQQAAERGVGGGFTGSPNVDANFLLRYLGTSLGLQQQGLGNLTALMGAVPRGTQIDPSRFFVTPAEQQQWQYLANQLAAAPDPTLAAQAELQALQAGMGQGSRAGAGGGAMVVGGGGGGGTPWYARPENRPLPEQHQWIGSRTYGGLPSTTTSPYYAGKEYNIAPGLTYGRSQYAAPISSGPGSTYIGPAAPTVAETPWGGSWDEYLYGPPQYGSDVDYLGEWGMSPEEAESWLGA